MSDKPEHFGYPPAGFHSLGTERRDEDYLTQADAWRAVDGAPNNEHEPITWVHCPVVIGLNAIAKADPLGRGGWEHCGKPSVNGWKCLEHTP